MRLVLLWQDEWKKQNRINKIMKQLSSNLTLLFKTFLPIFWLVFFGAFTVSSLFMTESYIGQISIEFFRILCFVFYILGAALLAFTVMRLKRVEICKEEIFISNYLKSFKYKIDDIERIEIGNLFIVKSMKVYFKGKTTFGIKINALTSEKKLTKALNSLRTKSSERSRVIITKRVSRSLSGQAGKVAGGWKTC